MSGSVGDVRLSVVVPSVGRASLEATLESIAGAGITSADEVLVVVDPIGRHELAADTIAGLMARLARHTSVLHVDPSVPLGGWGGPGRNMGIAEASGTHLVFLDDDDEYEPGALSRIRELVAGDVEAMHIWRMVPRGGGHLWTNEQIRHGNVGTPMLGVPRGSAGVWTTRYEGDLDFAVDSAARCPRLVWHTDVLVRCG